MYTWNDYMSSFKSTKYGVRINFECCEVSLIEHRSSSVEVMLYVDGEEHNTVMDADELPLFLGFLVKGEIKEAIEHMGWGSQF
jgi:hypothetical protein